MGSNKVVSGQKLTDEDRSLRIEAESLIQFKPFSPLSSQQYVEGFREAGMACFPLVQNQKDPAIRWGNLTPANCDYSLIQQNYGIKLPGHIVVVDIDPRNGGLETFLKLYKNVLKGEFTVTMAVRTRAGGYHFYFRNPEQRRYHKNLRKLYPGIDILSERSYVVGPGSVVEGKPYLLGEVSFCSLL